MRSEVRFGWPPGPLNRFQILLFGPSLDGLQAPECRGNAGFDYRTDRHSMAARVVLNLRFGVRSGVRSEVRSVRSGVRSDRVLRFWLFSVLKVRSVRSKGATLQRFLRFGLPF